ncbi:MAG: hypothetical protein JSW08_02775 [archaeon]|nr:MAG: hypothetical protein JSW08_02775 [archaeon]
MNGFILLDKPAGFTSHDCCQKIKGILKAKKTGHAGTLDKQVTGVLIIAINEAVKLMPLLERSDKEYVGTAYLHKDIGLSDLKKGINKFVGKINQLPPRRSRVKRQVRERKIYDFKILEKKNQKFKFFVSCEAGTYIRKLIHDLGQELGINANMAKLRRIKQAVFTEKESCCFKNLKLISLEDFVKRLKVKTVRITKDQEKELRLGKFLPIKTKEEGLIVALSRNKVIALVKKRGEFIKPERVLVK